MMLNICFINLNRTKLPETKPQWNHYSVLFFQGSVSCTRHHQSEAAMVYKTPGFHVKCIIRRNV